MTVISTNVTSLNAQAALATNSRGLSKAMQQLSTGTRINSASDDAAGLAVSTRLTSQIRGLNTAVRNANDAISMIQTAEGAAVEITNMLQRMRELSVQSANDTNTDDDRAFLDLEYQQLFSEMNRIADTTQWNGRNILDGSFTANTDAGKFIFQVGANSDQTVSLTIGNFTSDASTRTVAATDGAVTAADGTAAAEFDLTLTGTYLAGDVVSVTIGSETKTYEVQDSDIGASDAATLANVATGVAALTFTASGGVSGTSAAGVITFTGTTTTALATFTADASVAKSDNGQLYALTDSNILSRSAANSAITAIDTALTNVNEQRATMGATVNRLQYTVDNLTNVANKATESRSRVLDTDYSQATTELSKRQIISQAATAMLAQANQQPQTVLSLLK